MVQLKLFEHGKKAVGSVSDLMPTTNPKKDGEVSPNNNGSSFASKLLVILAIIFTVSAATATTTSAPTMFSATCDNIMLVYVDGIQVVTENDDNWGETTSIFLPAGTRAVALSCQDVGGAEGFIASTGDGEITDSSWKCSTDIPPSGWELPDYDDTMWTEADVLGLNGMSPWGMRPGISEQAKWIWASGLPRGDATVYCRKKLTTMFSATCDNIMVLYVDGIPVLTENDNNWSKTTSILIPTGTRAVALSCKDVGGPEGFIASTGNGEITDSSWKCSSDIPPSGWELPDYDDTMWTDADVLGLNGMSPWGMRPGISEEAKWIWAAGLPRGDARVYCRKKFKTAAMFSATCDNVMVLYVDGIPVLTENDNNWSKTTSILLPAGTRAVALSCQDVGGAEGFIASTAAGEITDSSWKCSSDIPPSGWELPEYDDTMWTDADVIGLNGMSPWGMRPGISEQAKWIWAPGLPRGDATVYCRKMFT